jgi:hypothetical protein
MPRNRIDRSPPQCSRLLPLVAGLGNRAAACLVGVYLSLALLSSPAIPTETPEIIVTPEPGGGVEVRKIGPNQVQLLMRQERQTLRPQGTLGSVGLGELSPLNPVAYVWSEIRIRIHSRGGPIPPYRLVASAVAPPGSSPGGITHADVGMGITQVNACDPIINPIFDQDPRNAPKDVDGIPQFTGTLGDLPLGGSGATIYSSDCSHSRRVHFFTIIFAVAPQFFTPAGTVNLDVLLTLETR